MSPTGPTFLQNRVSLMCSCPWVSLSQWSIHSDCSESPWIISPLISGILLQLTFYAYAFLFVFSCSFLSSFNACISSIIFFLPNSVPLHWPHSASFIKNQLWDILDYFQIFPCYEWGHFILNIVLQIYSWMFLILGVNIYVEELLHQILRKDLNFLYTRFYHFK